MSYLSANQMSYPDASKAWDPRAKAQRGTDTRSLAEIYGVGLAAAQSGKLPPPANAAAAAGNSPLNVPQAAMVVGDPIPVIWGRRRGTAGGVLTFPKATEARFENNATTVTSRYHMVIGEGRLPDIQRRDVRLGECRIGSFSQNYNQRAGSWTPGNFATAQTAYTVPTFPTYTGGGGNYQGLSTFEAGASFAGGSDDWRTAWNIFLRGGTIVERGRLLDSAVDSSDNIADLVLWALQRSGRVPDGMIDLPSLTTAATFTEAMGLWCNGEFSGSTNLGDWLIRILPDFLLRETKVGGRFGLRPLLPTNADGSINTGAITPDWILTEAAIVPDSFSREYSEAASRRPVAMAMLWRQQNDDTDVPIVRTLSVGDANASGPVEQHDLSQFATTENHAAKVGAYLYARRVLSTHTATVRLKAGTQTGAIVEGDIVQVYLQVETSREPGGVFNRFYQVESIGHSLGGEETLSLTHFPVNSAGQSLIALAVANATAPGTILSSNRTGGSCDLAGASTSTTVPSKSTSGTPISEQGSTYWAATDAFIDLFDGLGGVPSDAPPGPAQGGLASGSGGVPSDAPSAPVAGRLASGSGGALLPGPPSPVGDARCPNGYNKVTGSFKYNYLDLFGTEISRDINFVSTGFPNVVYVGEFTPTWGAAGGKVWSQYLVTWNDPVEGGKSGTTFTIPPTPTVGGGTFSAEFSIQANSYSCSINNGAAPPTEGPTINARLYRIVEGDTLESISRKMYGTPDRALDIYYANMAFFDGFVTTGVLDYKTNRDSATWMIMRPGHWLNIPA